MGTGFMEKVERLRGQKLSSEEKDMFIRMKDELRCSDDDALWQVVAVLEYQKKYYMELPATISRHTKQILADISTAADNEVAIAQGKLAESVVKQAKKLNLRSQTSTLVLLALCGMIMFFLICSLMMWSGYLIGTEGTQMPEFMFQMPSGLMIGILLLGCSGVLGYWAAREYADEKKTLWRPLAGAVASTVAAGWIFTVSL